MEGLKCADFHLILCSQDATSRPWIQFEAGAAHLRGIPIVPLCHGGITCAQLPVPLSEYEGIQGDRARKPRRSLSDDRDCPWFKHP